VLIFRNIRSDFGKLTNQHRCRPLIEGSDANRCFLADV